MLFLRCIIILGLMGLLLSHPGILPKTIRQTENDRSLIAQSTVIDKSIIRYYRMRSGLPPDLSRDTLKEMGIMQLADNKVWTYQNNGNSYVLTANFQQKHIRHHIQTNRFLMSFAIQKVIRIAIREPV